MGQMKTLLCVASNSMERFAQLLTRLSPPKTMLDHAHVLLLTIFSR